MKRIFKTMMLFAAAATAFASCNKDTEELDGNIRPDGKAVTLTITTTAPETRTMVAEDGITPMWLPTDRIGVSTLESADGKNPTQVAFDNDNGEASETTSFSGQISAEGETTIYTYYPYTGDWVGSSNNPRATIPATQYPTATSFDGSADILIGEPFTIEINGSTTFEGLKFKRVAAILKVCLIDETTDNVLTGEYVSTMSITASEDLAGYVRLYLEDGTTAAPHSNQSKTVKADYSDETHYAVGSGATFFGVYPQLLASGSTFSVTADAGDYKITRDIQLDRDVNIVEGDITTLNISISDENISHETSGIALPVSDSFTDVKGTAGVTYTTLNDRLSTPLYSDGNTLYQYDSPSGLRFSTSSTSGYLTTADLDLSNDFTVVINAKSWGTSDNTGIKVTAGDYSLTTDNLPTNDFKQYVLKFPAQGPKAKVRFEPSASSKRMIIADFQIIEGHDFKLPSVLTITSGETITVGSEGDICIVKYTVENPVEGETIKAQTDAEWITDFIYDEDGEVWFDVAANEGESREAVVTFTYSDATPQNVTVKQFGTGADDKFTYTVTYTVDSKTSVTTGGTAPEGSNAAFSQTFTAAGQITKDNSTTLTLSGYAGATITGLVLNMKSNKNTGAGTFSLTAGDQTLATISSSTTFDKWYDNNSYSTDYVDINVDLTDDSYEIKSGEKVVITIAATTSSLYIQSYTITYAAGSGSQGGGTVDPTPDPTPGDKTEYTLTLTAEALSLGQSYVTDLTKTINAIASDGSTDPIDLVLNKVMLNQDKTSLQWAKTGDKSYIYNTSPLGAIKSVSITYKSGSGETLGVYSGNSSNPSTSVSGSNNEYSLNGENYFNIANTGSATYTSTITIIYEK